ILPPQLRPPKRLFPPPTTLPSGLRAEGRSGPQAREGVPQAVGEAFHLSAEQKHALDKFKEAVQSERFHPFLLRGITDSGKTELYLRTIDRAIKQGRQALFLL